MRRWRVRSAGECEAPRPLGDAALVVAAQGDRHAFAHLYERYRDDMLRYTFYCLGDWDDAADATQQIFVNAFAALPNFIDRGNSFRPWLFRIAHNEVLGRRERRARHPQSHLDSAFEVVDQAPSPEEVVIAADDHQRLRVLLSHLPPDRQRICELRFAGLTDQEIASVLGKSHGAVRTAQSRAIAQLRQLMSGSLVAAGGSDG